MISRSNVPCNGCKACCKNDLIVLHPECGDDPRLYSHHEAYNPVTRKMALVLNKQANGHCIYLGEAGCTIHENAPVICREFDCRKMFAMLDRPTRRRAIKNGTLSKEMLDAGRARLHTLEE